MVKPMSNALDLGYFDVVTANALQRRGISTHGALRFCSEADIESLHCVGAQRVNRIKEYARENGFQLRQPEDTFQDLVAEIYGDTLRIPVDVLLIQLFSLFRKEGAFTSEPGHALGLLRAQGLTTVEDVSKLSGWGLRKVMGSEGMYYHSLCGWLLGAGISLAD